MPKIALLALCCATLLACDKSQGPVEGPVAIMNPNAPPKPAEPAAAPLAPPAPVAPAVPPAEDEACARVIIVGYQGADPAPPEGVKRDKPAAEARAKELLQKLKGGADFVAMAHSDSDGPSSAARDGIIGTYKKDEWPPMHAALSAALYPLPLGALAEAPIDAPYGYVLLQRCPVEKAHSRHILVRYKGAKRAEPSVKRSKADAEKRAAELMKKLEGGADFAELAKKESEDGSSERGGDIGLQPRGLLAPPYEKALFALKPGERSAVVETEMGFHIIERVPD